MATLIDDIRLFDGNGNLLLTADQTVDIITDWAKRYPGARFVIAELDHEDLGLSAVLGYGLAFPDQVYFNLPRAQLHGSLRNTDILMDLLRPDGDVRLIWVDPGPPAWVADEDL